jgi:hypothetical protein
MPQPQQDLGNEAERDPEGDRRCANADLHPKELAGEPLFDERLDRRRFADIADIVFEAGAAPGPGGDAEHPGRTDDGRRSGPRTKRAQRAADRAGKHDGNYRLRRVPNATRESGRAPGSAGARVAESCAIFADARAIASFGSMRSPTGPSPRSQKNVRHPRGRDA